MAGHTSARPQEDSVFRAGPAGLRDMGITVPVLLSRFRAPRLPDIVATTVTMLLVLATQTLTASMYAALPVISLVAFAAIAFWLGSTNGISSATMKRPAHDGAGRTPMPEGETSPALRPHDLPLAVTKGGRAAARPRSLPHVSSLAPTLRCGTAGWSELISRVSHELRTPLNAVIGFSDMMNAELLGPVANPRYREYLGHIRDSGRDLLKSAEDTLAMTSLLVDPCAPGRPRSAIPLQAVAHDAWNFLTPSWRGIRLDRHIPEDLEILAERRSLRQVLVNLFSEALRLTPDDGVIRLTADTDGECAEIQIATALSASATHEDPPSLAICMARALLELHGTLLLECRTTAGQWQAVTVFDRALQPDFFPHSMEFGRRSNFAC